MLGSRDQAARHRGFCNLARHSAMAEYSLNSPEGQKCCRGSAGFLMKERWSIPAVLPIADCIFTPVIASLVKYSRRISPLLPQSAVNGRTTESSGSKGARAADSSRLVAGVLCRYLRNSSLSHGRDRTRRSGRGHQHARKASQRIGHHRISSFERRRLRFLISLKINAELRMGGQPTPNSCFPVSQSDILLGYEY
jgi:hypothetical protein